MALPHRMSGRTDRKERGTMTEELLEIRKKLSKKLKRTVSSTPSA